MKNLPAFPVLLMESPGTSALAEFGGMTLRDYFAAKALQAVIAHNGEESAENIDINAERAYQYADAMLAVRDR